MTHKEAVRKLYERGYTAEAAYLKAWRNCRGKRHGWDGHVVRKWPRLWAILTGTNSGE